MEEWQAARAHVLRLEVDEAGIADHPPITSLPLPQYEPLLTELLRDPLVRYNFNTVPTDIAQVPLDRLVVYQKHIDLGFVGRLREQLGPTPDEARIFRMCLPYDHPQPPVQWSAARQDSFVFVSPSNDLRFLGAMPLQAGNVTGLAPPGALVGVIGIAVGFGTNFLNAVEMSPLIFSLVSLIRGKASGSDKMDIREFRGDRKRSSSGLAITIAVP